MLDEIQLPDGTYRKLGNVLPPEDYTPRGLPTFGTTAVARLVPRSEWDGLLAAYDGTPDDPFLPPTKDQNGIGQCNPTAAALLIEYCRARQGLPYVSLSGADLYARINGGRDDGSLLEDAMHELLTSGIGTSATCGELWKRDVFKGEASAAERNRFRALEVFTCPTFDHVMSAVFQGFGVVSGVLWYDSYTPDADGWLPRPGGRAGGHAIAGYRPAKRGRTYGVWHQNSWGLDWGLRGRFVIPEAAYGAQIGGFYAVRAVTDEGNVVPPELN